MTLKDAPHTLSLVVPVFNEEDAIHLFIERLKQIFPTREIDPPTKKIELVFVNDGSTDLTVPRLLATQSTAPAN